MSKKFLIIMLFTLLISTISPTLSSAASVKVKGPGSWEYRIDGPETGGKQYYHIHFYEKGTEKFCLRLDNMKPCDFNKNKKYYTKFDELPNKLIDHVTNNAEVKKALKKEKGSTTVNSWVNSIPQWALVSVATLTVFLATVTWFFPGDDLAAWAFFLRALA